MLTNVFKGNIKTGTISATFSSDFSNVDPDLLTASYADSRGGNPKVRHNAIAPGGSGTVSVNAAKKGLLEILVDTGRDDDSGRLQISRNGKVSDDESVQGPVRWVYTVIK